MDIDDAYRVLGLEAPAAQDEVNEAFRELARMVHPDRYQTDAKLRRRAEQHFKTISDARDSLLAHLAGRTQRPAASPTRGKPAGRSGHSANPEVRQLQAELQKIAQAEALLQMRYDAAIRSRRVGLLWLAGGAILTFATFQSGVGILFWGAILWGGWRAITAQSFVSSCLREDAKIDAARAEIKRRLSSVA